MRPLPDLPQLRIVPADSLQPHEYVDEERLGPLVRALKLDGVLRNPPIVMPVTGHSAGFVVLDGANRTTAFRQMGLSSVLVQVVHADDSDLRVETWNHAVLSLAPDELLRRMESVEGIAVAPTEIEKASFDMHTGEALCYVALPDGSVWQVTSRPTRFQERVAQLGQLAATYSRIGKIERTSVIRCDGLEEIYPDLAGLVVFPRFDVGQVVAVAADGLLFPPGLTRFVISPRALRINYPLERLASKASIEEKQAELEDWIRQAIAQRVVRYYAEATFLFDE